MPAAAPAYRWPRGSASASGDEAAFLRKCQAVAGGDACRVPECPVIEALAVAQIVGLLAGCRAAPLSVSGRWLEAHRASARPDGCTDRLPDGSSESPGCRRSFGASAGRAAEQRIETTAEDSSRAPVERSRVSRFTDDDFLAVRRQIEGMQIFHQQGIRREAAGPDSLGQRVRRHRDQMVVGQLPDAGCPRPVLPGSGCPRGSRSRHA